MITAARTMQPLPIRTLDSVAGSDVVAPQQLQAGARTPMQPLPYPDRLDGQVTMVTALRDAAFERMLARLGVQHPLPVVDPT